MEKPKGLIASGIWLLAMLLGPPVLGATFDAKLEAPRAPSAQSLGSQFRAHFDTFRKKREEADPAAFLRDAAAYQRWTDLHFALIRAMEEGLPLDDLSAFGLIADPDKSYSVDLTKFPEWRPLDAQLTVLNNADVLEYFIPALVARGFRDSDVDILRNYVATHDARLTVSMQGKSLVGSVARLLQAQRQVGQPLDLNMVWRYRHQKSSLLSEAQRQWALSLLDALDPQCQRILGSFLEEMQSKMMFGAASEPLAQVLENEAGPLVSGEYVQLLARDEEQIRKNMQERSEKLTGGQRQ